MTKKKALLIVSVLVVLICIMSICIYTSSSDTLARRAYSQSTFAEASYSEYLEANGYSGAFASDIVTVDMGDYSASEDADVYADAEGVATGDEGSITWKFEVTEAGFYNLQVSYIAIAGTNSDIQRQMMIDGQLVFDGVSQLVWKRCWEDEEITKKNNNEVRPEASEVFIEQTIYIEDYNRRATEPFAFYLSEGTHTITFAVIKEPVKYTGITWKAQEASPAYASVIEELKSEYTVYSGDNIVAQAERTGDATVEILKSSPSINIQKNYSDSEVVPYHPYYITYNTIGKSSFAMPGDSITWTITVPAEGLYEISIKGRQSSNRGVTSYRRLWVNGVIPYEEMNAIPFEYSSDMKHYTISDENNEPYLFYLQEGENTITLEVVLGDFGQILTWVEESMYQLNNLYLKTVQITGQVPDKYIDYEIAKKVADFSEIMQTESERLRLACEECVALTGEKGEYTSLLEKMSIEAAMLAEDPESVVEELTQWKNNIAALGSWIVSISNMPLEIDSIVLSAENAELPKDTEGFFAGLYYGTIRFFSTFFINNNQISTSEEAEGTTETIKVWMASSGKEQAQIIQNMIDETFTPKTGISVNLQLIPVDVVLRAALSGTGPDVVIGLSQATSNDFAMRNAIVDLSELEGFEEEIQRFDDSAITSATYLDGVYGIPEQQNFMMLFYRKDILDKLGLSVPQTWTEVKEMIPVLQMNNYDFYLPTAGFYPSICFQYGGNLYTGTGNEYGTSTGLYSNEAMQAFKDFTDFFTCYKLLVSADFQNRFRTGEMPIGITNYTTYCQLEIFAPEIKGLWSFAPLPGVEQEDGTINRSYVTDTVQSVIMSRSDSVDASWEFIRWWTGTDTQLQYANTLEAIMGTAARYPAADKEVLSSLPWTNKEVEELITQMEACVGMPAVPGNYMTTRMISYSFNAVVAESANPREALYLNLRAIDKELIKKRLEFGL